MDSNSIYQSPKSDVVVNDTETFEYAGFWIRFVATLVDTVLMMALTMPVLMAIYGMDYWLSESFINGFWDFLLSYILPAVVVILFWTYRSATPGKMMFGLKIRSLKGDGGLSVSQMAIRYIGYYPSTLVLCLGFVWVAFDDKKQGWHDKLANTIVVKVR